MDSENRTVGVDDMLSELGNRKGNNERRLAARIMRCCGESI